MLLADRLVRGGLLAGPAEDRAPIDDGHDGPLNRSYSILTGENHDHALGIHHQDADEEGSEKHALNRSYTIDSPDHRLSDVNGVGTLSDGSETEDAEAAEAAGHEPVACGGCQDRHATHSCEECAESLCAVCCKVCWVVASLAWHVLPTTDCSWHCCAFLASFTLCSCLLPWGLPPSLPIAAALLFGAALHAGARELESDPQPSAETTCEPH